MINKTRVYQSGVGEGTQSVLLCSKSTAALICVHMYATLTPAGMTAKI